MNAPEVEAMIAACMPNAQVRVESDDGTHFSALIIAEVFSGKRPLQRAADVTFADIRELVG